MGATVKFENRLGNANEGKIVIDVENTSLDVVDVYYGVTGPNGVLKTYDLGTPDTSGLAASATQTYTVDIPVVGSNLLEGDYLVQVRMVSPGDVLFYYGEETYSYNPFDDCGDVVTEVFSETVYCAAKSLIIKDETSYGIYTPTRSTTIVHPVIPGVTTPADTVSSDAAIEIQIAYMNVSYSVTRAIDLFYTVDLDTTGNDSMTFEEHHSVNQQSVVLIDCVDLCDIYDCVSAEITSLNNKAKSAGGVHNLPTQDQDKMYLINMYLNQYIIAEKCSDSAKMKEYYALIKTVVDCTGSCCDDGKVKIIPNYGELTYINGSDGDDGATWLSGSGAPGAGLGNDDDFYFDTTNTSIYGPKTAGAWGSGTDLSGNDGADGNTVLNGSGAPAPGDGNDDDFYIDTDTYTIYGPKTGGAWGSGTSLRAGGSTTAWDVIDAGVNLEFPWSTYSGDEALRWRRNGGHLEVVGTIQYTSSDPGAAEVPFLQKTWFPSGVTAQKFFIYGVIVDTVTQEIVGTVLERVATPNTIIYAKLHGAFTVSQKCQVSLLIPINE